MSKVEIVRAKNICAGERYGLDHLCMELYQAETLLILGNCSSGKEILKEVLIGKTTAYEGQFYWNEECLDRKRLHEIIQKHEIFYASPDEVLIESYTVAENIYTVRSGKIGIKPSKKAMQIQTANLMKTLGFPLDPEAVVRDLDYYERLLVCLAKAVSYGSKVILFDYMDNILQVSHPAYLKTWMARQKEEQRSFLIFSEKYDEVYKLCDRVLIMSDGIDKKIAPVSTILRHEIPYYWLGEAYNSASPSAGTNSRISYSMQRGSSFKDSRCHNILGVYDKDWGNGEDELKYFSKLYHINREELTAYRYFFDDIIESKSAKKKQYIFIENREYDKLLSDFPMTHNLMLPRNNRELLSRTSRTREEVLEQEFYKQFDFLQNRHRQYSDYFFYRLVAIYRFERFRKNLMILDNMFLRLDIAEEKYMREYIFQLAEKRKVILISHRLHEVDQTAGTILYVEDGKIVKIDTMGQE
ncbi:ATP-binding cassette domain-containing protein [Anaerocolumna sedimenticola]|uniref:ATP-binding cassette domain-containing protein n=1 Tax=Anaerocolumna sedimenticola TaxID=2696063 RepID=A0A6P1TSA1_9FIRM|nr:ATP-binding cassette domain-containing protein [Anaerocolumna sedimenticola]QHQ62841.1 ATP-binding cassette domain-containing protein [Anaerocolumna sedimenticola]